MSYYAMSDINVSVRYIVSYKNKYMLCYIFFIRILKTIFLKYVSAYRVCTYFNYFFKDI